MQSQSHQLSVFVRTCSARFVLHPTFQRSCGSSPSVLGESSFSGLRCRRVSSSYRPTTRRQGNKHSLPAKTICLRSMQDGRSFIKESFAQPAGDLHRPRILSGIMKPVAVAVALGVTMIPTWRSPFNITSRTHYGLKLIRIARKQPRIRKVIRIVRRRRQELQLISNSLAFTAFTVFII